MEKTTMQMAREAEIRKAARRLSGAIGEHVAPEDVWNFEQWPNATLIGLKDGRAFSLRSGNEAEGGRGPNRGPLFHYKNGVKTEILEPPDDVDYDDE